MSKTMKIGLALGSGGWRGLAHIGVIKSLIKHGYRISAVAGSSAGALIGGLYALWNDIDRVESVFKSLQYKDLLYAFSDPSKKLGLISGNKTYQLFQRYCQNSLIENLTIPYAAMATDLLAGTSVILNQGDLALAIRTSSSIPIIFNPVDSNHRLLVDGGLTRPIPADEVRQMGADIVIAVNIYQCIFPVTPTNRQLSKLNIGMLSYQVMLNNLARHQAEAADILIEPQLINAESDPFLRFVNNQQAVDIGEQAMDQAIPALDRLLFQRL